MENIHINQKSINEIDKNELHKMRFIYIALEDGWDVKKRRDTYVFSKKHEGKKEIFEESFLRKFIESSLNK